MEKEGRVQRYLLMSQLCREHSTRDVVVAHHGDDQIETFLMRCALHSSLTRSLYRGSGYAGLACMKPVQEMDDGTRRIRPLLAASKDRLLATCKAADIPFVIDPSNADLQYDRNRVRAARGGDQGEGDDGRGAHPSRRDILPRSGDVRGM